MIYKIEISTIRKSNRYEPVNKENTVIYDNNVCFQNK